MRPPSWWCQTFHKKFWTIIGYSEMRGQRGGYIFAQLLQKVSCTRCDTEWFEEVAEIMHTSGEEKH
jgi:predicted metal-binding protein